MGPLDSDYGWAVKFVRGRREVPFLLLMNRNNWPSIVTLVAYFVTSTCKEEAIIKWRVSRKKKETGHPNRERSLVGSQWLTFVRWLFVLYANYYIVRIV